MPPQSRLCCFDSPSQRKALTAPSGRGPASPVGGAGAQWAPFCADRAGRRDGGPAKPGRKGFEPGMMRAARSAVSRKRNGSIANSQGVLAEPVERKRNLTRAHPLPPPAPMIFERGHRAGAGGGEYSIHLISKGELTLPLWNPFCSRPGLSSPLGGRGPGAQWAPPRTDRGGSRDRSPLKNFILEKDFPLPYPKGTDYISPVLREGAGGGPLPSRQGRDTVSPAGSGPAPQWGASRTDGRGNGDRR